MEGRIIFVFLKRTTRNGQTQKNSMTEKQKLFTAGHNPAQSFSISRMMPQAGNGAKHAIIPGKGALNNRISSYLMTQLEGIGIPTHFIRSINMREQLVREGEIIPVEVVCP